MFYIIYFKLFSGEWSEERTQCEWTWEQAYGMGSSMSLTWKMFLFCFTFRLRVSSRPIEVSLKKMLLVFLLITWDFHLMRQQDRSILAGVLIISWIGYTSYLHFIDLLLDGNVLPEPI